MNCNDSMELHNSKVSKFSLLIVSVIAFIYLIFLFVSIQKYTVNLTSDFEISFVPQKWYFVLIRILLVLIISCAMSRLSISKKMIVISISLFFLINIAGTFILCLWPTYDQYYMTWIASMVLDGDYSQFLPFGYMDLFPFQYSFMKYIALVFYIFGKDNYYAVQILNVIFSTVFIIYCVKLSKLFSDRYNKETGLFIIAFLPLSFFCQYIYGTIGALTFSTISIYYVLQFLLNNRNRIIHALLAALCNVFAILLKNNSLIFMIAEICVIILFMISKSSWKNRLYSFLLILLFLSAYFLSTLIVNNNLYKITGRKEIGTPKISWVAMGLQEGDFAEGWYNYFNRNVYWDNDCNVQIASELSKQSVKESITYFGNNPKKAVDFFTRKNISQWANPSFESINLFQQSDINNPNTVQKRNTIKKIFLWHTESKSLDQTHFWLNEYLKIYELLIIFGTIIFIASGKLSKENCVFLIVFIGGFTFHTFWEAASQYMFPYFMVLIPYGVVGLFDLGNFLRKKIEIITGRGQNKKGEEA